MAGEREVVELAGADAVVDDEGVRVLVDGFESGAAVEEDATDSGASGDAGQSGEELASRQGHGMLLMRVGSRARSGRTP